MKRTWLLIGLASLLIAASTAVYLAKSGHAPSGQATLKVIDNQVLAELRTEFNRAAPNVRLILLLSPT